MPIAPIPLLLAAGLTAAVLGKKRRKRRPGVLEACSAFEHTIKVLEEDIAQELISGAIILVWRDDTEVGRMSRSLFAEIVPRSYEYKSVAVKFSCLDYEIRELLERRKVQAIVYGAGYPPNADTPIEVERYIYFSSNIGVTIDEVMDYFMPRETHGVG